MTFTLAGLADRDGVYGELSVCGETYLAVHHYLLGRRRADDESVAAATATATATGVPLASLDHITRIYSHPQAFGQTTAFVRRWFPNDEGDETKNSNSSNSSNNKRRRRPELIDTSSTSRAAELAAADASGASAAISSALAAETSGLDVLARCIEDRPDNTTRFYVLRRNTSPAPATTRTKTPSQPPPSPKSLVSFTVPHRSPGALADVLDCFRRARLNLTSINSLPSLAQPFHYLFFVEFEHGDDEGASAGADGAAEKTEKTVSPDERVRRVLAEVATVAESHRLLGTWNKPLPLDGGI